MPGARTLVSPVRTTVRIDDALFRRVAAYAIENNATLLSADRGFARFERLRWRHPLGD